MHALGVLLFVLLAGRHPVREASHTPADLMRGILDTDARRLSETATAGPRADERARTRATTPKRLRGALRGDLENIVAKALKKSPAERPALPAPVRAVRRGPDRAVRDLLFVRSRGVLPGLRGGRRRSREATRMAAVSAVMALDGVRGTLAADSFVEG